VDEEELQSRLSRIATSWDLVRRAHGDSLDGATVARHQLMERYHGAAYRYLLAALRDPDAAAEMFQEFALRFARGDFRNADPGRGRFRQFLKTVLINLVRDYRRKGRRAGLSLNDLKLEPVSPDAPDDAEERRLLESWRSELLARTWVAMQDFQRRTGRPYYALLRLKSENPALSSPELAAQLADQLRPDRPWNDAALRKLLQRAREEFAELLVQEISYSLEDPSSEELEAELVELGLHAYCRPALNRRKP
jgi:DNA-directed RNA polymerase specialized sigma24 family protein